MKKIILITLLSVGFLSINNLTAQTKNIPLDQAKLEKALLNTKLLQYTYNAGSLREGWWLADFQKNGNVWDGENLIISFETPEDFEKKYDGEKSRKKYKRNGLDHTFVETEFIEVLTIYLPDYKVTVSLTIQILSKGPKTLETVEDELNLPGILAAAAI